MKKSKKQKKEDLIVFTSQSMVEIEHVEMTPGTMLHFHDYLEAELIVEADSMQQLNGLSINLKRGVFYIVRPMIDCHRLESKPLEIYKFYLKPGVISEALYNKIMLMANPLCVEFDEKELDMAIGLFEIMLNEQENKGTYSIEIIKSAIESLFTSF